MDYQKELESYPDASVEEKRELEQLAGMQKDIAIADSAADFIRHPFFKLFENHINDIINDTKGSILKVQDLNDLKVYQAKIQTMIELKQWWNTFTLKGAVARKAIEVYESDTDDLNARIQEAVDKAQS